MRRLVCRHVRRIQDMCADVYKAEAEVCRIAGWGCAVRARVYMKICISMFIDMCMDACTDMCTDMYIDTCADTGHRRVHGHVHRHVHCAETFA